jgi:hypothetical protein
MTTVAAIAMARLIGAPQAPALDQQFCVDCGAIGSNVQTRSKKTGNVRNLPHTTKSDLSVIGRLWRSGARPSNGGRFECCPFRHVEAAKVIDLPG